MIWFRLVSMLAVGCSIAATGDGALITDYVKASVGAVPESLRLDAFYRKHADAMGIAVVGSERNGSHPGVAGATNWASRGFARST
jgi:hypothetical protein